MRDPQIVTVTIYSSVGEAAHSTFAMDEVTWFDSVSAVSGLGSGLGRPTGDGTATFRVQALGTATTYDASGSWGWEYGSLSSTHLDASVAASFTPGAGAPRFEPVVVSHYESGPVGLMAAGIGSTYVSLTQTIDDVPLGRLTNRQVENGFVVDVSASSLATPYVDGVPNPTGVLGAVLTDVIVEYEFEAATYGGGNDRVKGGGGTDVVALGGGRDVFRGGGGIDHGYGEGGTDRLFGQGGNDSFYGGRGGDRIFGQAGRDWLSGQGGKDLLNGGGGGDELYGDRGRDTLLGKSGGDKLEGGAGNDRLIGGGGGDELDGGRGRDTLVGGAGDDTLSGGAGRDRFDFRNALGHDEVMDFKVGVDAILVTKAQYDYFASFEPFTADEDEYVYLFDPSGGDVYRIDLFGVRESMDVIDALVVV